MRVVWKLVLACALGLCLGQAVACAAEGPASLLDAGERIYREGRLPQGGELHAERAGGLPLDGAQAACVNCHRRSGLGSYEGPLLVPPVIGPYLFRDRATNVADLSIPHLPGYVPNATPYDLRSLARALRSGQAPGGRTLNALMPRYALDDEALAALVAYLRQLSRGPVPGVSDSQVELATILAPDTSAADRAAVVDVLRHYVDQRNARVSARAQPAAGGGQYRASRLWRLQVWTLSGPSSGWQQQLQQLQAAHPVFAVLSGLGGADWSPVHRFCEQQHVPCLLPNVDLPVVAEQDFYPVYYSRGVLLEADLFAGHLGRGGDPPVRRVVQVFRGDDIGAAAAASLADTLRRSGGEVVNVPLDGQPVGEHGGAARGDVEAALSSVGPGDALVLWLRPADLAALGSRVPTGRVYVSGLMGRLESAPLAAPWKAVLRMGYPFDPPDLRRVRMNFPHAWLRAQGIAPADDRLQSDTWLACMVLDDAFDSLLDSYIPELLVERYELMLGPRLSNAYYPRLGLAAGQRFASKGGYLVRFSGPALDRISVDGPWVNP